MKNATTQEISYFDKTWYFIMGPTPIAPEVKMREIVKEKERYVTDAQFSCEMRADDLADLRKKITKAATKNDEAAVRELATEYVSVDMDYKRAVARLKATRTQLSSMLDLQSKGQGDKDMLEFIQCHNRLMAPVANLQVAKTTMGQFEYQRNIMKEVSETINEGLAEALEDEEESLNESNKTVEAIVSQAMGLSSLHMVSVAVDTSPDVTSNRIQQFLSKK